jgi:rhodanese-related sulfurtransferase
MCASRGEWESGVIIGSQTIFVGDLGSRLSEIPRDREGWSICASGRRAAIAASLLDRAGISVRLVAREGVNEALKRFEKGGHAMPTSLKEMIQEARAHVRELPPKEVAAALEQGKVDLVVDVREPEEWSRGHIPGSVNIPRGMLEIRADPASPGAHRELSRNRDARIVVYCLQAPSTRSLLSAHTLYGMGYERQRRRGRTLELEGAGATAGAG